MINVADLDKINTINGKRLHYIALVEHLKDTSHTTMVTLSSRKPPIAGEFFSNNFPIDKDYLLTVAEQQVVDYTDQLVSLGVLV